MCVWLTHFQHACASDIFPKGNWWIFTEIIFPTSPYSYYVFQSQGFGILDTLSMHIYPVMLSVINLLLYVVYDPYCVFSFPIVLPTFFIQNMWIIGLIIGLTSLFLLAIVLRITVCITLHCDIRFPAITLNAITLAFSVLELRGINKAIFYWKLTKVYFQILLLL